MLLSRNGRDASHSIGELLFRIPLTSWGEARVGVNSYALEHHSGSRSSGFEDLNLAAKVRFLEGSDTPSLFTIPSASVLVATTVPTGHKNFGAHHPQPELLLSLGWDLTQNLSLVINQDYTYGSEAGKHFHQWLTGASFSYSVTDRLGSYLEYFREMPFGPGQVHTNYVNGGFAYLLTNNLQVDLSVGVAENREQTGPVFGTGVAWRY